jgi:hypothetical protein
MSQKQIQNKTYSISDEIKRIADEVIDKESLDLNKAKIEYLLVYPNISKTVAGRCIRSGKELKFFSDFDYIIEMSGEVWDLLDDETKHILAFHELLHVYTYTNKKGETVFKLKDHDIQDFSLLINRYGIDWFSNLKTQISSIYDMDPAEESKITV